MRHIVIAGPGRSGTTLLVKLLTELGFDTGADRLEFYEHANAGLETDLLAPDAPYVVKDPDLTWMLPDLLETGRVAKEEIEWLVVPLRNLADATASRIAITARQRDVHAPGGLVRTVRPGKQQQALAETTYGLFQAAGRFELPLIVLEYPLFATDSGYAYRRLEPLLGGRTEPEFAAAWSTVVDPTLVRNKVDAPRFAGSRIASLRLRRAVKKRLVH